jgi:predicted ATP-grasp superfamily ATP-dependent carboligase
LLSIGRAFSKDVVVYIPVEEDTTLFFLNFIKEKGNLNFKYNLPSLESFNISRDKFLLNEFCKNNGIPAPSFFTDPRMMPANNEFVPLIVKPRIGSGAKGLFSVISRAEFYKFSHINLNEYVIQEKIGDGKTVEGAFFLCNKGKVLSSYCHKRERTFPLDGGVTVYSKLVYNKDILQTGKKLLEKLKWSGIAMLEFLQDVKTGEYKVIEINPRFWGSVLLSEFSGANFVSAYIKTALGEEPVINENKKNVAIRWLAFDILNWIKRRGKIRGFWHLNKRNTCYINCTYAKVFSSILFHLFFYISKENFKVFLKKWKK